MTNQDAESGYELVLDNRKLIIAFAVLIAFCGCFFVVGFIEGKRQGYQEGSQFAAETHPSSIPAVTQTQPDKPATVTEEKDPAKADVADQQLDWYKNVSRPEGTPETITRTPAVSSEPAAKTEKPEPAVIPSAKLRLQTAGESYTVQVGAFRQKHEMEIRADILRKKGFDCRTEPPLAPGEFYYLRVGKYHSRAEAVAMQLRLKKAGISSFIKTIKAEI